MKAATAATAATDPAPAASSSRVSSLPAPTGVHLELLREDRIGVAPLFMVSASDGTSAELAAISSFLAERQGVYAVAPVLRDEAHQPIETVDEMADLITAAIRLVQPLGPYRIAGHSVGGLVALETARRLGAEGASVQALFLIDTPFDEPPARADGLRARLTRSWRNIRLSRRKAPTGVPDGDQAQAEAVPFSARERAARARARYRPTLFEGRLTLLVLSTARKRQTAAARLWRAYAPNLDVVRIDADAAAIAETPVSEAVADVIDHRLAQHSSAWTGLRPVPGFERPLILTTVRWFSDARLAHAMIEAGYSVSACRPRAHVLELVDGLTADTRLSRLRPMHSLASAIRKARPDIVLPGDEHALVLLRRFHARAEHSDPETAAMIARSLGNVADWPAMTSRAAVLTEAARLGVSAPATRMIENSAALREWAAGEGAPVVLKTDGSWGGRGVVIVRDPAELERAWSVVSNPPGLTRAVKRTLLDSDDGALWNAVRRVRPVVNAQEFVSGREAIATAACVGGKVLTVVCLEVLRTCEAKGPAAAVRIIDNPTMAETARLVIGRFGLTGFCGFDFMLTSNGDAQLLEVNPRVTPTCYLLLEGEYPCGRAITLFPADIEQTAEQESALADLDVPPRAPVLVDAGEQMIARKQRPMSRVAARLTKKFSPFPMLY